MSAQRAVCLDATGVGQRTHGPCRVEAFPEPEVR